VSFLRAALAALGHEALVPFEHIQHIRHLLGEALRALGQRDDHR
jgi:hypothetical protein